MFRELEFQSKVFNALDYYLDLLNEKKAEADDATRVKAVHPSVDIPDFTKKAWEELKTAGRIPQSRANIPFSSRQNGMKRPVPNVTLKVPTGGGKTWLAVKSTSMILNKYLGQNAGFILWIVPNEAIYTQTLKHFRDRTHPYRQAFERAAAGRVKILTKTDRLNAIDVETHLCVMVLMLQAANRTTKETLRMFNDSDKVHGFFPADGEQEKHRELTKAIPNLDAYGGGLSALVKPSLGNALRIIRPVVVMDEGHRATSDLAYKTLYDFNPSFVLELTATPRDVQPRGGKKPQDARYANLLVEITGKELDREGMVKMPMILDPHQATDWKIVLAAAVDKLNVLQKQAAEYQAERNRYIRPILLVQAERTGKDQRDGNHIHAEDVREYLMRTGFDDAQIAIKTAEQNDLKQPENQNLLSPRNQIRVIITKEALQEGWDCPFAYVLCSLATRSNVNAMTQLVGRILRQPNAEKTDVEALDQCYIFTHQAETNKAVGKIKAGLEQDGLGDLVLEVTTESTKNGIGSRREIERREQFREAKIFLPQVRIDRDGKNSPLDYETDILTHINWKDFDHAEVVRSVKAYNPKKDSQIAVVGFRKDSQEIAAHTANKQEELIEFDPVQVVRQINDIILNPFVAWSVVTHLVDALKNDGYDDVWLGYRTTRMVQSLREELIKEQDRRAEDYFCKAVTDGEIQFRLRADGKNWQMPKTIILQEENRQNPIIDKAGHPMQRSLFEYVSRAEFNCPERDVAVYLDGQEALGWWHRNVARRGYGLKGWKKNVIYPDFIFSVQEDGKTSKLVALETKGKFLDGTEDTEYKRDLMRFFTQHFRWDNTTSIGELELDQDGVKVNCDLILVNECERELSEKYFSS